MIEALPVADGWADVVISNRVINLCANKPRVFSEVMHVLRPGRRLQFADIANGKPVPEAAIRGVVHFWHFWVTDGRAESAGR